MIEIYRVAVPKDKLQSLSENERVLLLLLGYVSNQISMLQKLIMFATNVTPERDFEQHCTGVQTQMIVRLTIGAVNEAWRLITTRFIQSPLQKEYLALLDKPGQEAFERLKKQFGGPMFAAIRNNFAYHYPDTADADEAFQAALADDDVADLWNLYASHHGFNSVFLFSDLIYLHGIKKITGEATITDAHKNFLPEVSRASLDVVEFARAFFAAVWVKHFGTYIDAKDKVQVENAPKADDVMLPFFVDIG